MANISSINNDEPESSPQHNRWYNLTLGSSFRDNSSKFTTLRYEFKPASIDKTQPGLLHKNKENRVSVEFQNNQAGKPKVTFEGSSEDYKENDAVLFFDDQSFRLEQLHRSVKRLRHVRLPGETAAPTIASAINPTESHPSPVLKPAKLHPSSREPEQPLFVEVERIEMGVSKGFDVAASSSIQHMNVSQEDGNVKHEDDDDDESMDVATVVDAVCSEKDEVAVVAAAVESKCDDTDEEDIADIGGGEHDGGGINTGLSAAEALTRARVNVDAHNNSSSSSAQSDSDSSSSSSSSSTSSSESSDSESSHSINSI